MKFDGNMAGRRDSQNEVHDLFEKLVSWRDESHKHISGIMNSHNNTLKLQGGHTCPRGEQLCPSSKPLAACRLIHYISGLISYFNI